MLITNIAQGLCSIIGYLILIVAFLLNYKKYYQIKYNIKKPRLPDATEALTKARSSIYFKRIICLVTVWLPTINRIKYMVCTVG